MPQMRRKSEVEDRLAQLDLLLDRADVTDTVLRVRLASQRDALLWTLNRAHGTDDVETRFAEMLENIFS